MSDQLSTYLKILNSKPPNTLFHYTTPAGLLGIVNSKKMWATDIRFLNDKKEFQHSLDITHSLIDTFYKPTGKDNYVQRLNYDFMEFLRINLGNTWSHNVYVSSFTEEGDLLSQWRGYCHKGGFSIGFSFDLLAKIAGDHGCFLYPCVYKLDDQENIIKELLLKYNNQFIQFVKENPDVDSDSFAQEFSNEFIMALFAIAPMLKHESFKEEKEWRIVYPSLDGNWKIQFRSNDSEIIPYIELPICATDERIIFDKLVISPSSIGQFTKESVSQLVKDSRIPKSYIVPSKVPYKSN